MGNVENLMSTELDPEALYIPPKEFNMSRDVMLQVKEMVERNLNVHEIAQRMHVDVSVVQSALKLINNMLT